ncbi:ricin-type beta-trefoil lectin domain protein [Streptomyces sp. NPDC055709]
MDVWQSNAYNGAKVSPYQDCNGTAAQGWTHPSPGYTGPIRSFLGGNWCLDVKQSGTTAGTPVQLYTCNNTAAQNFTMQSDGQIRNPNSGLCVAGDIQVTASSSLRLQPCGQDPAAGSAYDTYWTPRDGKMPDFPDTMPR